MDFTGLGSAVDNIMLRELPAVLDELCHKREVIDRHMRLYAAKLAAIQGKYLPPPARAANLDPPGPRNVHPSLIY